MLVIVRPLDHDRRMDGSGMATSGLLPLFGALASLAALPILGLESQRGAEQTETPPTLVAVDDKGRGGGPRVSVASDDPRFVLRLHARDVDGERDVASVRPDDEGGEVTASRDLVIAHAALSTLNPEYRFKTTYSARGKVSEETLYGDLIVGGRGDPTIDAIRLREVANKLAQGGVLRITGAIVLDDSYFRTGEADEVVGVDDEGEPTIVLDEATDAGVSDEASAPVVDTPSVPSTVRAFPFAGNRVALVVRPSRLGALALIDVVPRSPFLTVKSLVRTASHARRLKTHALLDGERGLVVVTGMVAPDDAPRTLSFELADGAFSLGHTLSDELRRRGVRVTGRVSAVDAGGYRRWLMTDFSPPLTDLLGTMLRRGGDSAPRYLSESLLRVLAAEALAERGTRAHGLAVVKAHLEENLKIASSRFTLEPGKAALPPRVIVDVLTHTRRTFEMKSELEVVIGAATLHPQLVARLDAPLLQRTRAAAFVDDQRADLAGYIVTDTGSVLAFALQVTNVGNATIDEMWVVVNRALQGLVQVESKSGARDPASVKQMRAQGHRVRSRSETTRAAPAGPAR
jgi:PBP4 family serine-type D-alanyl-D-alanine carboxypeptidase